MQNMNTCPRCGTANASQNLFCQSCGAQLIMDGSANPARNAPTPPPTQIPKYGFMSIDHLGARLDGWADSIPEAGSRFSEVAAALEQELQNIHFPQVNIFRSELTPGGITGQRRPYLLIQSYTGATMAIQIAEYGKSLYVSWDIYIRPVIKWRNVLIMLAISLLLSAIPQISSQRFSFGSLLIGTAGWMITIGIGAALLGKVMRNSFWAFFLQEINLFAADDVTAMMLTFHKAFLRVLDSAGIESSTLRNKMAFRAGRQERLI